MAAPIAINPLHYDVMIGTGGIGAGSFFVLDGNHTLGREESRTGHFLQNRDYAKLHIITHYVQRLLGPAFKTIPIGAVGDDDAGRRLREELETAGSDTRRVRVIDGAQTMNCICLLYPDGSGGNLTVNNSACSTVSRSMIWEVETEFAAHVGRGIALAVPEVPIDARVALLELGTRYRFLRAASFTSEEIRKAADNGVLEMVDLLVINRDEAAALGKRSGSDAPSDVATIAGQTLRLLNPSAQMIVTAGEDGSWACGGTSTVHAPPFDVPVASTAGAGDAFFSGVISGMAFGLALPDAQQLGTLAGAFSVTSPHTINPDLDGPTMAEFASHRPDIRDAVQRVMSIIGLQGRTNCADPRT